MTRKRRRLLMLLGGMACLGVATALVLAAFRDNLVFFYSPSELALKPPASGRALRIGGLVETHSVERQDSGLRMIFKVTDGAHDVTVAYTGVPPALFREGQGVVAEGRLDAAGVFQASTILAKHDERYMPREVVDALKASGRWQETGPEAAASGPPGSVAGGVN